MKKIKLLTLLFSIGSLSFAQTGPGGVGSSSNIGVWLDASTLGLTNNDPVSSWTDQSGNGNNATEVSVSNQPTYISNQINGLPVVRFDGSNDRLGFSSNLNSSAVSTFIVYKRSVSGVNSILTLGKHILYSQSNVMFSYYLSPLTKYTIPTVDNQFSVYGMKTASATTGAALRLRNGTQSRDYTRTGLFSNGFSGVGAKRNSSSSYSIYFTGDIAEIVVFNEQLNDARFNIVSNHLAAKYGLSTSPDYFSFDGSYGFNVKGIGQEANGSNTSARGNDSLLISNASSLGTGDYLLMGHDNAGYGVSSDVPAGVVERWDQVWRVTKTGTPGTISVEFFLGSNGFASPSNYVLLVESGDGNFSNGGTSTHQTGLSFNAGTNSILFTNVNLNDGDRFTLAEAASDITSIADGAWNNTGTWSCTCIPSNTDIVVIDDDSVTISANAEVLNLTIDAAGGILSFTGSDTLKVYESLTVNGLLYEGSGTIASIGDLNLQTFDNGSGSRVTLNNFYVNNSFGTEVNSGVWAIKGSLQVSTGGLDVSNADSMILLSNSSQTSQILESMDNAFTGNFTMQRYISARSANYANFGSPATSATVADIDDNLFVSGVNGPDGNARKQGGGTFFSIWTYDNQNQDHDSIFSTATVFKPGKGYEIYLADTTTGYNGGIIDITGSPNNGMISGSNRQILFRDWNLFSNPYHAFIDYDDLDKPFAPDNYYIFNSSTGTYDFFSGGGKPAIAPWQGFWVFKTVGGGHYFDFKEENKVSSTSSSFLRKKEQEAKFSLAVTNGNYSHKMQVGFNQYATSEIDENDAYYLPSPIEEAPAIFSRATNSSKGLILNTINNFEESIQIPITVKSGISERHTIETTNIESLLNHYSCAYLTNEENSDIVDLLVENSYSFNSNPNQENNFRLVLSNSFDQCQKLIDNPLDINQKIESGLNLRQSFDQWFVDFTFGNDIEMVEINVYNINGQQVLESYSFTASNSGSVNIPGLSNLKGIYLIQVKTQDDFINKTIKL